MVIKNPKCQSYTATMAGEKLCTRRVSMKINWLSAGNETQSCDEFIPENTDKTCRFGSSPLFIELWKASTISNSTPDCCCLKHHKHVQEILASKINQWIRIRQNKIHLPGLFTIRWKSSMQHNHRTYTKTDNARGKFQLPISWNQWNFVPGTTAIRLL